MSSTFGQYFENNPTLKLLRGNYAGFILGFFHDSLKDSGQTQIPEEDLESMLDQHLQEVRLQDSETLARDARYYLNLWCEDGYRLLQKRFSEDKSSYVYQLTQHSEKALTWLEDLRRGEKRGYTTSDSRFGKILTELRRIDRDTNDDPEARRKELLKQRDYIDAELKRIRETGKVDTMDTASVKDALHDLEADVEAFLSDFRAHLFSILPLAYWV